MKYLNKLLPLPLGFAFVLIAFGKILILKATFFGDDSTLNFFPLRMYVADLLSKRILPLWTPDIFCGFPLFAGGEVGIFSPFNLLFSLIPSVFTYNLFLIILPFFLATFFTYYFCRLLLLDRFSSFVASIAYFFSGFFFYHIHSFVPLHVFALLPLNLILLELAVKKNKISYLILIAFVIAIQFLSGNPQLVLISFLGVVFYAFFIICFGRDKPLCLSSLRQWVFILIFLGIVSSCLAAVQLLSTYELYKFSRGATAPSFKFMTELSVSPRFLLAYFFHLGYPPEFSLKAQNLGYVDVFPLFLTFFALSLRRDRLTKFLALSLLVCIVLSLGKYTPLYKLFFYLPLINRLRYPMLFLFPAFFFISLLSGLGMNYILGLEKERRKRLAKLSLKALFVILILLLLFALFSYWQDNIFFYFQDFLIYLLKEASPFIILSSLIFGLLVLYFSGKVSGDKFKKGMLLFLLGTLFLTPPYLLPYLPKADFVELLRKKDIDRSLFVTPASIYPKYPGYVKVLKKDKNLYRVYNDFKEMPLQRNLGLLYKIPCVFGYLPLETERFGKYLALFYEDIYVGALHLMNVKYILAEKGGRVGAEDESVKLIYNKGIGVYKNKKSLPRAFIVSKFLLVKKEEDILKKLGEKDFNPKEMVILEEEIEEKLQIPNSKSQTNSKFKIQNSKFEAQIVRYSSQEVIIQANLKRRDFLVLTDTYYPGWEVYVDGKKEKIYQADYLFRAVYLNEGLHKVRFVYKPLSFKIGLLISLGTALLLLVMLGYLKYKH